MTRELEELFHLAQRLRSRGRLDQAARWQVSTGQPTLPGPFDAAEIAYLIFSRHLAPPGVVVNLCTGRKYVVTAHRALAAWFDPGRAGLDQLWRGLCQTVRRRARLLKQDNDPRHPRAGERASNEELTRALALLGLEPGCSLRTLRRQHRLMALDAHPDRSGGCAERMKAINWATGVALWACRSEEAEEG